MEIARGGWGWREKWAEIARGGWGWREKWVELARGGRGLEREVGGVTAAYHECPDEGLVLSAVNESLFHGEDGGGMGRRVGGLSERAQDA